MKLHLYFVPIHIYLLTLRHIPTVSERVPMVYPQYRRFFKESITSERVLQNFVGTHKHLMAYCNVYQGFFDFNTSLSIGEGTLKFRKALEILWGTPSHSIIFSFDNNVQVLRIASREFFNYKETPQVWTYWETAQGPGGDPVETETLHHLLAHHFVDNKILAVGWTRSNETSNEIPKYTREQIDEMDFNLHLHYRYTLVIVLDAVILSHTPPVYKWMTNYMRNMAVLIRLYDQNDALKIKMSNLKRFVRQKKNGPFFFDLPSGMHDALISNNFKFTTLSSIDSAGGRASPLTGLLTLSCALMASRQFSK